MDHNTAKASLRGCYVTLPTMFHDDPDLSVDYEGVRRLVRFLISKGMQRGRAVLLAGGAAGDFSTLTTVERINVAAEVIEEADSQVPVAVGAQTTSTHELVELAQAAHKLGADYIQVSPPFYFPHTAGDFYEHVLAAAEAVDIGVILYNTHWTSTGLDGKALEELLALPNVVGLKWSAPDSGFMEFEQTLAAFAHRVAVIDNQMRFVTSNMLGAQMIELHPANYWPEWALEVFSLLEQQRWLEAQQELIRVGLPFMQLWAEMEHYTSGDGYLDKLCLELRGLGSSRCRPPTRDVRDHFLERTRQMLLTAGTPDVARSDHTDDPTAARS